MTKQSRLHGCISRESNPELGHGKTQCYRYTTDAFLYVCFTLADIAYLSLVGESSTFAPPMFSEPGPTLPSLKVELLPGPAANKRSRTTITSHYYLFLSRLKVHTTRLATHSQGTCCSLDCSLPKPGDSRSHNSNLNGSYRTNGLLNSSRR